MRLVIVGHVVHYSFGGMLYAYGPYAREIGVWADLFEEVWLAAPCREEKPPGDATPFTHSNIRIVPQKETGGQDWRAKAALLLNVPMLIWHLCRVLHKADAIHVRCPGNLGLLGIVLAPLFSRRLVAKYAGQWSDFPGEAWTNRLQKKLLRSRWWRGPVTVYGQWPGQPRHIVPFFTSILTTDQITRAREASARVEFGSPLRVLYVGRLSASKNLDILLRATAALKDQGIQMRCNIIGDGPERQKLESLCASLNLNEYVEFSGAVNFEQIPDFLERADILVLASDTEGWPKAIAEAMAFGLVCIGSNRGLIPQMLSAGRGLTVPPRDVEALVLALEQIAKSPSQFRAMRTQAAVWAQEYSLDGLREALGSLLAAWWAVPALSLHDSTRLPQSTEAKS